MWFLSSSKTRRGPVVRSQRCVFQLRLETLEDRCQMSANPLDTTFGGALVGSNSPAGTVLGPSGAQVNNPSSAMVIYPDTGTNPATDDKIVVGGLVNQGSQQVFALIRYNANGSLDTSFGTQGIVSTVVGSAPRNIINSLALQNDGKIVAVGFNQTSNFVVARYTASGQLDSTFGTNGIVQTKVVVSGVSSSYSHATAVVIQGAGSSEKIYVGGDAWFYIKNGKNNVLCGDFALVRYNANGSLDTSFGTGGIAITPNIGGNSINNFPVLALQPDGKVVLAGPTHDAAPSAMAAVRYTTSGRIDSASNDAVSPFGTNGSGIVTLTANSANVGAYGVLIQSGGDVVLSGYSVDVNGAEQQTLARLTPGGALDTTFGSSGYVITPSMIHSHNIVQAANGDLVTAGTVGSKLWDASDDFVVAAFLPTTGALDTTFGTNGVATAPVTDGEDVGEVVAIQPDGKIVAGGFSYSATTSVYSVAVARFVPPNTKIGSFQASSYSFTAGTPLTLTVSGILNSNPSSTIAGTLFYLDSVGGTSLASPPVSFVSNSNGIWT
jgi:uncharacterized delta-60 repeat protein